MSAGPWDELMRKVAELERIGKAHMAEKQKPRPPTVEEQLARYGVPYDRTKRYQ